MIIHPEKIEYLVVHCSDTMDHQNLTALDIHKMHLKFGWDGIGYHKIIRRDGLVEKGRPEYWIGAHVYGFNKISLGVCLIGSKEFTSNQMLSLKKVLRNWKLKYPKSKIKAHNEMGETKKTCPNFDVHNWCKKVGL